MQTSVAQLRVVVALLAEIAFAATLVGANALGCAQVALGCADGKSRLQRPLSVQTRLVALKGLGFRV